MKPLEKVARAICEANDKQYDVDEEFCGENWEQWIPEAKAAIEALMEPDEYMIEAAGCYAGVKADAEMVFIAMLREALKE